MSYLTEERQLIKDAAASFTDDVVLPAANRLDPEKGSIPGEVIAQMAELGFFGIRAPEKYGGSGLGCFEYCLIAEELSRGWMSVASIIARSGYGVVEKIESWSEEKRQDYCERAVKGDFMVAMALSEPNVGSDLASISCKAVPQGDNFILTGSKYWCTFCDQADAIVVIARTSSPSNTKRRHEGLSAFLVEKPRGALPENCKGHAIPKIGYFGWNTFELAFDGCAVPRSNMIGKEGHAFAFMASGLESARAHTAARSIGLAQGALNSAVQYSHERIQFEQPISQFQDLRFKIARMASEIEAARQLNYFVCNQIDRGGRCDKEASMAKWYASEMSERVTSEALQILGGAGYTTHFPVERYWRDARLTKIFEGTSEIQLRIISDQILGKPAPI
jgi:alkylation response protein AidB-like acyl-CoA dehydrogenase